MKFSDIVKQAAALLQESGRVTYRTLKREFALDDAALEDLKFELIEGREVAADQEGKLLVWTGTSSEQPASRDERTTADAPAPRLARQAEAERRQLTVLFCDLVGSTALSAQLDPEDLREVVQAYQQTSATVISRFEGHTAQYLGDGLLVYFGYPVAHEDDAQRAVRAALGIVAALQTLSFPTIQLTRSLQVRIGIHTGLVVIGEIGSSAKREMLALGETPNIAARLQGLAEPDTVVLSATTQRLVTGLFACQELGPQLLKGRSTPLEVYRVVGESAAQSRFEVAVGTGLTPLVGRESELGFLRAHWEQAKTGAGQVVLLSGEPGIGKSRLVQELKEQLAHAGVTRIEFRCSPYHQHSALYPIIDHLQRLLQFAREDSPTTKLEKLQHMLSHYRFPQAETVPLLAALLSLPHPEGYPPLTVSPQKQKEKTQEALVSWLVEEAEQAAVCCVWEDVHWADPSSQEFLGLLIDQVALARLLLVLTFRPEFTPPWAARSHISVLTLSRLGRSHVREMVNLVAAQTLRPLRLGSGRASTSSGRTESESSGELVPVHAEPVEARPALPEDLIDAVVARTDGVPLFVEELTKMVMESVESIGSVESHNRAARPIAIPATLHDSLMARLDRLGPAKEVAQLGAILGREFPYELLQAVAPVDETSLQQALTKLVGAEVLYQRGLPPQARYLFKHALIQDAAYQSLLKRTRQQCHKQIAQVLGERFPETKETQPELLAHHYTAAGLLTQAIPYWQQAGQRAIGRSANIEAIGHLTKGLELLTTLPDTPERIQQELALQTTLGPVLIATKGYTASEVEHAYTRARELCRQVGETPQLCPVLRGLHVFYFTRADYKTARELAEQLLTLAQRVPDPVLLLGAHLQLGLTLFFLGELTSAQEHLEQGIALYDPQQYRSLAWAGGHPVVQCLSLGAQALCMLGYPNQALEKSQEALTLAQELSHPFSLAMALVWAALLHQLRQEGQATQERAEAVMTLSTEQGFPHWLAEGTILRGWALAAQGQGEEGIAQMRQGLAAWRATGAELGRPFFLALLAEAYGKVGQVEEGLTMLTEALAVGNKNEERLCEAELYRLKGQLTLQSKVQDPKSKVEEEAEECFHKALEIARRQEAKSLELRAVMSLSRLWQQQGKKAEAQQMLAELYGWFTEGFDTKGLQEAKALLEELG